MALNAERLAARVWRIHERRRGVALYGLVSDRAVSIGACEEAVALQTREILPCFRDKFLDLDLNEIKRIFPDRSAVGEHNSNRLPDITHTILRQDWLLVRVEFRE